MKSCSRGSRFQNLASIKSCHRNIELPGETVLDLGGFLPHVIPQTETVLTYEFLVPKNIENATQKKCHTENSPSPETQVVHQWTHHKKIYLTREPASRLGVPCRPGQRLGARGSDGVGQR